MSGAMETMQVMKISLTKYVVCCFCILMIVGYAHYGMAAEEGIISGVKLAPDLTHIVIQHNGRIGSCSTFVIGPSVQAGIGRRFDPVLQKLPGKVKVDRAPINEIRLGYANSRVRVVVDFGDNPVPSFQIEKGDREIRLNMGKRLALGVDRPDKPEKRTVRAPSWAKAAASTDSPKRAVAAMKVKSARVDDNRVVLELADTQTPDKAYLLTVEMDRQDFKVRGATLRDNYGTVQRFDRRTAKDGISRVKVETVEPWDRMGAAGEDRAQYSDGKAKFKWGLQSAQHAHRTVPGPTRKGAFQVERFVLKPRASVTSRTSD